MGACGFGEVDAGLMSCGRFLSKRSTVGACGFGVGFKRKICNERVPG